MFGATRTTSRMPGAGRTTSAAPGGAWPGPGVEGAQGQRVSVGVRERVAVEVGVGVVGSAGAVPVGVVERAAVGAGGDVALVAVDATQAPEDEDDALGELAFDLAEGGEAGDGGLALLLPGGVRFEAGEDGGGGEEAVACGVLADDCLAWPRARAGGALRVPAVGLDLLRGGHDVLP